MNTPRRCLATKIQLIIHVKRCAGSLSPVAPSCVRRSAGLAKSSVLPTNLFHRHSRPFHAPIMPNTLATAYYSVDTPAKLVVKLDIYVREHVQTIVGEYAFTERVSKLALPHASNAFAHVLGSVRTPSADYLVVW